MTTKEAYAVELTWKFRGGVRFQFKNNGLNLESDPIKFDENLIGANVVLGVAGFLEFNKYFDMAFAVDIGEFFTGNRKRTNESRLIVSWNNQVLNPKAGESSINYLDWLLQESFFVRQLYGTVYFHEKQWISLDFGMIGPTLSRALLYDDFGLGLKFSIDLFKRDPKTKAPLRISLHAFLPDNSFTAFGKKSPVLNLAVNYAFEEERAVGLFFTYMYDGDGLAGVLLQPIMQEIALTKMESIAANQLKKEVQLTCQDQIPEDIKALHQRCMEAKTNLQQKCSQNQCNEQEQQTWQRLQKVPCPGTSYYVACKSSFSSVGHHFWTGAQGKVTFAKKLTIEGAAVLYFSWFKLLASLEAPAFTGRRTRNTQTPASPTSQQPLTSTSAGSPSTLRQSQTSDPNPQTIEDEIPLRGLGFAGELKVSYEWFKAFTTSLFFLIATGDRVNIDPRSEQTQTIHAFMAISPRLQYTNIFFNGGINAETSQRAISMSGITGRGYIAPGMIVRYYIEDKVQARLTATPLWATAPPIAIKGSPVGQFYGFEVNVNGSYRFFPWFEPVLQIDFFFPGNFFAQSAPPAVMFQIYAGVNFHLGG